MRLWLDPRQTQIDRRQGDRFSQVKLSLRAGKGAKVRRGLFSKRKPARGELLGNAPTDCDREIETRAVVSLSRLDASRSPSTSLLTWLRISLPVSTLVSTSNALEGSVGTAEQAVPQVSHECGR